VKQQWTRDDSVDEMRAGHKWTSQPNTARWLRLNLANPSARILLVFLVWLSLNFASCYDSILTRAVKTITSICRLALGAFSIFTALGRRNPVHAPVIIARAAENTESWKKRCS
jgi:hypothetical protein